MAGEDVNLNCSGCSGKAIAYTPELSVVFAQSASDSRLLEHPLQVQKVCVLPEGGLKALS